MPEQITKCVLRTDSETDLSPAAIAAPSALADQSDASFAPALRQLLSQSGGTRYAEACIGLEQLSEVPCDASIDKTARAILWKGPISDAQISVLKPWSESSLFSQTFKNIEPAVTAFSVVTTFAADPANPTSITGVPPAKLTVTPTSLSWAGLLAGQIPTTTELTNLAAAKTGAKPDFATAVDDLIAIISHPENVTVTIPIVETFWKPRTASQADLDPALQNVLLIAKGLIQVTVGSVTSAALMTLAEGAALEELRRVEPTRPVGGRSHLRSLAQWWARRRHARDPCPPR